MTDWIEWRGGECPARESTIVEARLRNGIELIDMAREFDWRHEIMDDDIVAYRIVKEPTT